MSGDPGLRPQLVRPDAEVHGAPHASTDRACGVALVGVIYPQSGAGRIAVGLHVNDPVWAVSVASPRQVQGRLRAPICTVEIERILADFSVVADQALVVDVSQITLATGVAGEVEEVPDENAPEITPRAQDVPRPFVVCALEFPGCGRPCGLIGPPDGSSVC
jgi:hypothetical protein